MNFPSWLLMAFVIIIAILTAAQGWESIALTGLQGGEIGSLLSTVVFTALVIERAVEVVVNNQFNDAEAKADKQTRIARIRLRFKEQALNAERDHAAPDPDTLKDLALLVREARDALMTAQEADVPKVQEVRTRKTAMAGMLSTALGLGAAVVGVRVLDQFAGGNPELAGNQLTAFGAVDIVLTTALLAGGADGIHKLVKRFVDTKGPADSGGN